VREGSTVKCRSSQSTVHVNLHILLPGGQAKKPSLYIELILLVSYTLALSAFRYQVNSRE